MTETIKTKPITEEHEIAFQQVWELVNTYSHLPPIELLAVASNLVGQLIIFQDPDTHDTDRVMSIIQKNIQLGNMHAVERFQKDGGNA